MHPPVGSIGRWVSGEQSIPTQLVARTVRKPPRSRADWRAGPEPTASRVRRLPASALDDDLVGVAGLPGVEAAQAEVIDDEQVRREDAAQDPLGGVVGAGLVARA